MFNNEMEDSPVQFIMDELNNLNYTRKFLKYRKVFLWGPVMDDSARSIVNQLMFLEAEKPGTEIQFYINSPGGSVTAGLAIYDTMKMISSPVSTICFGHAASMGAILLSGGTKGSRYIFPSGEVMIHQPSLGGYFQDQATNLEITAAQIKKTKLQSAQILADNCGHSLEKILKDFDRDYWMDANESVAYGIVDKIMDKITF